MTLNISQLRERLTAEAGFAAVEQVGDSIIRSTRRLGALPFAVYYFDVAQDLPETQAKLTKYQDRVIGTRYFEGRKSLQWSNYLYFVTSDEHLATSEVSHAKELIERDRSYARKFVISEDELESVFAPLAVAPAKHDSHASILSIWADHLVEAGLDKALLSDDDLPTRLRLIESSSSRSSTAKPQTRKRILKTSAEPLISSLQLKNFRNFPLQRNFEFGTVNLIFGANGSGKTSLLEAIELLYCGRNKRNPDARPVYELMAAFANNQVEKVTASRSLQMFRERNLTWYGQPEIKTNNLYQTFARFNFLDTDAAVSLADSTSSIEDDFSKLLVGPDASKTWRDIERVNDTISSKLRELRPLKTQIERELATLEKLLKESSNIQKESDSIHTRLEEMIHRIGWGGTQGDRGTFARSLVGELAELVSLAQQATAIDWIESPVSIDRLAKYCREAKVASDQADRDITRLELLRRNQKRLAGAISREREATGLTAQVKRLIEAGVPERVAERNEQQSAGATYSGWLAGLGTDALEMLSTADPDVKLTIYYETAVSKRSAAETLLIHTKIEYENFSKLRDQSVNLSQELRAVAARILQGYSKPDECPLCHTRFGSGELTKHINVGVDVHLEALGQTLLTQLRERESAVHGAIAVEAASKRLRKFCELSNLAIDIPVRSALAKVENAMRGLAESRSRIETLNSELLTLESQGLAAPKLNEISARLRELGYPLADLSQEGVERLLSTIKQDCAKSSLSLEADSKEADGLQQSIETALGIAGIGFQGADSTFKPGRLEGSHKDLCGSLSRLKERLTTTEKVQAMLSDFFSSFPWPRDKTLAELAVEAELVQNVATKLQAALNRERQAQVACAESIKRRGYLEQQRDKLIPRIIRLAEAQVTLETLQKDHSLTNAMKAVLNQNRTGIEAIFPRIHSPAEFSGLGSDWTTLVRKADGSEAKLSEISTGQRAAFALSVFLAQNAQLTVAPPVILIDDPIAHVDDLNSLSFLDYLREIVLEGRRQVFFATANDKLATLFERKFDFLGSEGFRRFNLERERSSTAF